MTTASRTRRRVATALAVAATAFAGTLTACSSSTPESTVRPGNAASSSAPSGTDLGSRPASASPSRSPGQRDDAVADSQVLADVKLSAADAAQRALAKLPGSRVASIGLEREHGTIVWEVDIATGTELREVHVDAATGTIVASRTDHDSHDHARDVSRLDAARLSASDALAAAEAEVPGARVVEIDLDDEHGSLVWEVDLIAAGPVKHELTVDAMTGAVTRGHR